MIVQQVATDAFRKWFEEVLAISMKVSRPHVEEGHQIAPHLMVFERDPSNPDSGHGRMAYVPVDMNTTFQKDKTTYLQRALASNMEMVNGVVLVTEAWTLAIAKDDKEALANMRKGISDNPERTESVVWSAMRGNMQMMAFAPIERPEIGTPKLGEPMIIDAAVEGLEGRLVGGEPQQAS